ncbi:MAG: putative multidrug export ATP-binding/permease protein [Acidobacteria bacterium]|nr:putative multidrug export ATP-binding/permease protein [Acidobacteriota bacterium]
MPDEPQPKKKLDRAHARLLLRDAKEIIWRARGRLLLGLPLMLINRLSGIVIPGTTKYVIDNVIGKRQYDLLWIIVAIAGTAAIVGAVTDYALAQILGLAAQRSITDLRKRIQQHVQKLPIRYFDATKTGALVSRVMNDAEGIRNLVGTGLVQLFGGVITATLSIAILFYLSPRLAGLIFAAIFGFATVLFFAFNTARPLFKKRSEYYATVSGRLTEGLSGIRVVKAYRAEKHESRMFAKGAHDLLRNVLATMRIISGVGAITSLLVGAVSMSVLLVGSREVLAGRMTIGGLISFTLYLGLVVAPVVQIVSIGTQLSEAFAGLERMREVLGEPAEDAGDPAKPHVPVIEGAVEFRDVTFEYTEGVPVLKGVTFSAPAGTSIALVGPSGSGKSTLISIVAAFHKPTGGSVTIDGRELDDLRIADYRAHIGLVPQDSFLFADSIYDNIAMGNPRATREEVLRAAKIAHVDEFAEGFADGYETIVGERGVKLSGGQKQRVAIARAIVADPRILILDEATSSLDSESEALIQDGLNVLMKDRTTFVIAHRLSTIRNAGQILVLEDGRVTERGTHAELMALGGRYRALYEKQYGIAVNLFVNDREEIEDLAKA